ncbi:MAG: SpoIIE family protein phosphatase [Aestuariivita sp.]|nr:SpoIIE family protein phosphatase [Aestuariivita sp.]
MLKYIRHGSLRKQLSLYVIIMLILVSAMLLTSAEIRNDARAQRTQSTIFSLHLDLMETALQLKEAQLREMANSVVSDSLVGEAFREGGVEQIDLERVLDNIRDNNSLALLLIKYPNHQVLASSVEGAILNTDFFITDNLISFSETRLEVDSAGSPVLLHLTPIRRGDRIEGEVKILLPLNDVVNDFFPDLAGLAFKTEADDIKPLFGYPPNTVINSPRDVTSLLPIESGLRFGATYVPLRFNDKIEIGEFIFLREITQAIEQEELLTNLTIVAIAVVIIISLGLFTRSLRIAFRPLEAVVRLLDAMSQGNDKLRLRTKASSSVIKENGSSISEHYWDEIDVPYDEIRTILGAVERFRTSIDAQKTLLVVREQLENAKRIQQSLLPQSFDQHMKLDIFGRMRPALEVAGDFFDIFLLDNSKLAIVIADVSGKGLAPALFASQASALFRAQCHQNHDPSEALKLANRALCERNPEDMFLTCIVAVIEPETGILKFVNAGHCPPIVIRENGEIEQIETEPEPIVGVIPEFDWTCHQFKLEAGERCLLYSDGFDEAQKDSGEMLGVDKVLEMFSSASLSSAQVSESVATNLFEGIDNFSEGAPQADDITIITLRPLTHPQS